MNYRIRNICLTVPAGYHFSPAGMCLTERTGCAQAAGLVSRQPETVRSIVRVAVRQVVNQ